MMILGMREQKRVESLLAKLISNDPLPFPASGSVLLAPETHGVYAILRRKKVLYVGRTTRGKSGLRQRLGNHLRWQSSFSREYARKLELNLRKECTFCYVEVSDDRMRALLEAHAIGRLCPVYLGTGASLKT